MSNFINNQTGKPVEETTVLLEVGVPTSISGKTYLLDASLRAAVRALQGKKIHMQFGSPGSNANALDQSRTCGLIENVRLIECRQTKGTGVIIGDVKPWGPFGVHVRDCISGAEPHPSYYGLHAMVSAPVGGDGMVRSVREIVSWYMVSKN